MVFCYQNCFDLLWEKLFLWSKKPFEIRGWRPRICKFFEFTRTIYSIIGRLEQFLVTECFLTCSNYILLIPASPHVAIGRNCQVGTAGPPKYSTKGLLRTPINLFEMQIAILFFEQYFAKTTTVRGLSFKRSMRNALSLLTSILVEIFQ